MCLVAEVEVEVAATATISTPAPEVMASSSMMPSMLSAPALNEFLFIIIVDVE